MAEMYSSRFIPDQRPMVIIDPSVYCKMMIYVAHSREEIAWYGFITRGKGKKSHVFTIEDIFLYPQRDTFHEVKADEERYSEWLAEKFGNDKKKERKLRFQGHSHPYSPVKPSDGDRKGRVEIIERMDESENSNDFFLFLIINHENQHDWELYDTKDMLKYGTEDIDFCISKTTEESVSYSPEDIYKEMEEYTIKEREEQSFTVTEMFRTYLRFGKERRMIEKALCIMDKIDQKVGEGFESKSPCEFCKNKCSYDDCEGSLRVKGFPDCFKESSADIRKARKDYV